MRHFLEVGHITRSASKGEVLGSEMPGRPFRGAAAPDSVGMLRAIAMVNHRSACHLLPWCARARLEGGPETAGPQVTGGAASGVVRSP